MKFFGIISKIFSLVKKYRILFLLLSVLIFVALIYSNINQFFLQNSREIRPIKLHYPRYNPSIMEFGNSKILIAGGNGRAAKNIEIFNYSLLKITDKIKTKHSYRTPYLFYQDNQIILFDNQYCEIVDLRTKKTKDMNINADYLIRKKYNVKLPPKQFQFLYSNRNLYIINTYNNLFLLDLANKNLSKLKELEDFLLENISVIKLSNNKLLISAHDSNHKSKILIVDIKEHKVKTMNEYIYVVPAKSFEYNGKVYFLSDDKLYAWEKEHFKFVTTIPKIKKDIFFITAATTNNNLYLAFTNYKAELLFYDIKQQQWLKLKTTQNFYEGSKLIMKGNSVFIIGGDNKTCGDLHSGICPSKNIYYKLLERS